MDQNHPSNIANKSTAKALNPYRGPLNRGGWELSTWFDPQQVTAHWLLTVTETLNAAGASFPPLLTVPYFDLDLHPSGIGIGNVISGPLLTKGTLLERVCQQT